MNARWSPLPGLSGRVRSAFVLAALVCLGCGSPAALTVGSSAATFRSINRWRRAPSSRSPCFAPHLGTLMLTPLLFRDEYIGILAVETLGRLPVEYTVGLKALCAEVALALQSTALLRGIVAFAKNVGMSVTGEGVETSEHSACLRALGCDHAQGFLFARPSPPEAITALLDEQQSDPQRLAA